MPRITRKQQKVFAVNATNNGVFGSLQANDPTHSQDPDVIQGRTAYSNGWDDATYSAEKLPPLEEFQALQYLFSRQLAYLMQDGIAEWDTNTTYYKGALVKAIQSDGSFILYASLVDNNQGNLVTDTTKWVITNTSTNFHQGIPNWRADVIYSVGDWVKSYNSSTGWTIYESTANNNLNNAVTDTDYWSIKPFTSEFPLFMVSWFDHEVDDMSWLRADTFSWQDGTVYSNAYNHLVDDISGISSSTETIGSYTITYYQATDGHKICFADQETTVANIYNESGVAWYYILDTTNQRFKLPRTKFGFTGYRDAVGKYVAAGLPNITGSFGSSTTRNFSWDILTGCFSGTRSITTPYYQDRESFSQSTQSWGADFNASLSNSIYGNSTTVQPPATQMYLYFYVGQFTQTATEQTAGLNASLFNGKADIDLNNLNSTGKAKLGPTVYEASGLLVNQGSGSLEGYGKATVYLYKNGIAEVHFNVKITTTGTGSTSYDCGINRDLLTQLNSNIPTITPTTGGSLIYCATDGTVSNDRMGYGGTLLHYGLFWEPARVYTTAGGVGGWPASNLVAGQRLIGVCYGTYTV